jgi:hypothetical protein
MPPIVLAIESIFRIAGIVGPDLVNLIRAIGDQIAAAKDGHALTPEEIDALRNYGSETAEQIDARINGAVARSDAPAKPNV